MIHIRSVRAADVHDIVRIYIDSWNAGFGTLMPTRKLTPTVVARWAEDLSKPLPHRWWVAESDGSVAGFVGIGPSRDPIDPSLGEIDAIAVDPARWRAGIGRELMSVALKHLAGDGYRQAVLWTLANYERGQRFYDAMGWKADGGLRDEGRQIRYRHPLSSALNLLSS
jgi:GNAT superfamily N-acetyltransferase